MRIINRILFLALVLILLGVGVLLAMFTSWRSERMQRLSMASEIAKTEKGSVEYLLKGEGAPLLIFHGSPGGYDQAIAIGDIFQRAGFQVIAPSRSGYLRTPLATGLTPEEQADAFAALLTSLGVEKTCVIGFSSGAPAAVQFALQYPERTSGLLLISPILIPFSPPADPSNGGLLGRFLFKEGLPDLASWMLFRAVNSDPWRALTFFLQSDSMTPEEASERARFIMDSPEQSEWFRTLTQSYAPMSARIKGLRNDLVQLRALPRIPYATLKVPTLIIYGSQDADIHEEDMLKAVKDVPLLDVQSIEGVGQLVFLGPQADRVRERCIQFLQSHLP